MEGEVVRGWVFIWFQFEAYFLKIYELHVLSNEILKNGHQDESI